MDRREVTAWAKVWRRENPWRDAGEAVAVGDGFRGGALNLAARLC